MSETFSVFQAQLSLMKIILIGLGRLGREIALRLLAEGHSITVIERDIKVIEEFLENEKNLPPNPEQFRIIHGEATSVAVWEYLPLEDKDIIISSLRVDEINMALCKLLREFYKNWSIQLVVFSYYKRYEDFYANYNCRVFYIPQLLSQFVDNFLSKNIRTPLGIGLGKNEILEVQVSSKSPYAEIPVNVCKERHWRIALVYRGNEIILPVKKIRIKAGDKVILVGDDPKVVMDIAKSMASGEPQFPLSYGENLIVFLKESEFHYLREFQYIWKHLKVKNTFLFTPDGLKAKEKVKEHITDYKFLKNLYIKKGKNYSSLLKEELINELSGGLIGFPYRKRWLFFSNINLKRVFRQEIPFIIPRLSFPYEKIFVSLNTTNPTFIIEQAFEIAYLFNSQQVDFYYVILSKVLMSSREAKNIEKANELIENYKKIFQMKEKSNFYVREGNPVKVTQEILKEKKYNLLIVGFDPQIPIDPLEPETPRILTEKVPISVIGISSREKH